jgi:hypothetical protein
MRFSRSLIILSLSLLSACGDMDKGVTIHNTEPVVTFESPIEGTDFQVSEAISFEARVEDKESDPKELELEWTSDLDGLIEEGTTPSIEGLATFTTAGLSEGLHTITLKATDPGGQIGSDYLTVKVETDCLALTNCDYDEDGYTEEQGDCDDNDDGRHPDADEIENGIDDDCDDLIDEGTQRYDDDGDGYTELEGDCNDDNDGISPVAEEIADGVDQDCDDIIDEGTDVYDDDGDGFSEEDGDCNDDNSAVYPGAEEVSNGVDDDCDDIIDEGSDGYDDDGDGYTELGGDCDDTDPLVSPVGIEVCGDDIDNDCDSYIDDEDDDTDEDGDGFSACEGEDQDCDDDDEDIHPDADEVCGDEVDNDCDGDIDADDSETDADEDGQSACDLDCDDTDPDIYSGAIEICDLLGVDEDCDGEINEAGALGTLTFYADADEDGHGGPMTTAACSVPDGYTASSTDCDDTDGSIYPGAIEVCDGADNDCDDSVDEDSAVGAPTWYYDGDGDGFGSTPSVACEAPSASFVSVDGDCNDADDRAYPGATEYCDGIRNNCDLPISEADGDEAVDKDTWYHDWDEDGYGDPDDWEDACDAPVAHVSNDNDCNDWDDTISPEADEICDGEDPGIDEDCDELINEIGAEGCEIFYRDEDGDNYGHETDFLCLCEANDVPSYDVLNNEDCCDDEYSANPGATSWHTGATACGDHDWDCDGLDTRRWSSYGICGGYPICGSWPFDEGWVSFIPLCGHEGYWLDDCDNDWPSCDMDYGLKDQQCR